MADHDRSTRNDTSLDRLVERLRVRPGDEVDLSEHPTDLDVDMTKEAALARLARTSDRIDVLQQRLYAESKRSCCSWCRRWMRRARTAPSATS